jgi:alpha-ketoglutarate-dependent taurine dioxygenase
MKHQRRLTVNPVAGALGAEVGGVTLAGELSDHEFSEIHRVFLDHQVLFFRGQHLPSSALKAFATFLIRDHFI